MAVTPIKTKQAIETITIGATEENGGTRSHAISVGGEEALPFLVLQGSIPHAPVIAYEFWDAKPEGWNSNLASSLENVWDKPETWASHLVNHYGAELLFLRIMSVHPEYGSRSVADAVKSFRVILEAVSAPMTVIGCGVQEIDKELLPAIAEASSGENLLLGTAVAESYREITQACIAHGHSLVTESPIDINIAKQVNILTQDAGLPGNRIVMYATTGALGYGLEYAYSIMEKTRIVGLEGDRYMNKPQIAFVGQEAWRAKEAGTSEEAGITWETLTGEAYLQSGGNIIVVRHPESGKRLQSYINRMMKG